MSNIKAKVPSNTSTDLHFDLLADPTKIKVQKSNINLTNITETDDNDDNDDHVIDNINNENASRKSSKSSSNSISTK